MVPVILSLILVLCTDWQAQATTYYVSTTGVDANDGLTTGTPKRTVAHCVSIMLDGDTCYVRGGTYVEGLIRFTRSGFDSAPIKLLNYPNERPVISFVNQATTSRILLQHASGLNVALGYITIEGFELKNGYDGLKYYNVHNSVFRRLHIHDMATNGVQGSGGHHILFDKLIINHNGDFADCTGSGQAPCAQQHGLYIHGDSYTITNCLIYDSLGFGITQNGSSSSSYTAARHPDPSFSGAANWIVSNNTFAHAHNAAAITIWGSLADNGRYENNIFYENHVYGTSTQGIVFSESGWSGITIRNNLFYGTGTSTVPLGASATEGVHYTQSGNTFNTVLPGFVNGGGNTLPTSPDYRLLSTSAAIGMARANEFARNATLTIGAFDTVGGFAGSITGNTITLVAPMSNATPIQNLSTVGVTVGCSGSACPSFPSVASVSLATGTSSNVNVSIAGISGNACESTNQGWTVSLNSATATWTANDNIGPFPGLHQAIFSFSSLVVANLCSGSPQGGYPPGYYIYYKFESGIGTNAMDESANHLDGTLMNGAAWSLGKTGLGVGIQDNSTQHVAMPYGSGVNPTTQSLTIAFGVNIPQGAQTLSNGYLGAPLGASQRFYITMSGGTWRVGAQASNDALPSDLTVEAGWNHLCLTVDATTDTITLHKNGVASISTGARKTVTSYTLAGNIDLGRISGFTGGDGIFDDFLVYQSVQDCAAIYAAFQAVPASPSWVMTQAAIQAQAIYTVNGLPNNIAALNAPKTVVSNGAVAIVFQVHCENVLDCEPTAFSLSYKRNGSSTRIRVPNVESADGIWMYGDVTDVGLNIGQTTTRLTGSCSYTPGTTQATDNQTPSVDLPQDGCITLRYLLKVRNPGDYFDLALQTENGTDLNGGYAAESRITVVGPQASAP